MPERSWTVLLIGGASATGKSTLAQALAKHYDVPHLEADLFYLTLRRATPREMSLPGLQPEAEAFWAQKPELLVGHYLRLSTFVCDALEAVVARQHLTGRACILEGTWLLPRFAIQAEHDGVTMPGAVRGLFLHEADSDELVRRRLARADAWTRVFSDETIRNIREMRHRYGQIVRAQAEILGLPVVESRPFDTLFERALDAIDRPRP